MIQKGLDIMNIFICDDDENIISQLSTYIQEYFKKKELNPHVIIFIVTSFMEYLDSAMEIHVFRYLNKPIDKLRLFRNLKDALRIYNAQTLQIAIETKSEVYTVYTHDIIFVEARDRKITVYTTNGSYRSIHSMNYWVNKLNMCVTLLTTQFIYTITAFKLT